MLCRVMSLETLKLPFHLPNKCKDIKGGPSERLTSLVCIQGLSSHMGYALQQPPILSQSWPMKYYTRYPNHPKSTPVPP